MNLKYKVIMFEKVNIFTTKKPDELGLREVQSVEQLPVKLAYTISINKSQGMTLYSVTSPKGLKIIT